MKKGLRLLILGLLFMLAFIGGNKSVYASDSSVTMLDGASIRVKTEDSGQGLRFTAKLTGESIEHGFYLVYGKATLEDLQRVIKDKTLLLNEKPVFKVVVPGVDKDGNFSVVLTGIPEEGYLSLISVFAYVDGIVAKENTNRSIAEVAIAAKQHGEEDDVFDEIATSVGNKVILSSEDVDEPILDNDESISLPVLEKDDYDFLGWATQKDGEIIDELPEGDGPLVLYPVWKPNFEILEKEDALAYLEDLLSNGSLDFLKEGMLKLETEIFINSQHIHNKRGIAYNFDMLLNIDEDLELKEFYLNGMLDLASNMIMYGEGTYLYRHIEEDGDVFDDMIVFPLNSQALNMFVPVMTNQELFDIFPASPKALNDIILEIEQDLPSYFTELGLLEYTKVKVNGNKTTLTISLDGDVIVEILKTYWPYKEYQYRDLRNLNVNLILNLENDKFKRIDIDIKGLLYDYGMISAYYVDEEIVVPQVFNYFDKDRLDYFEYTLHINGETHVFKVDKEIIGLIIDNYDYTYDRYYEEGTGGEIIHEPFVYGYDTVELYKDSEYTIPLRIYDFYDEEVSIYAKTEIALSSFEDLIDSYFIDGFAVLNYKAFYGDNIIFYETDLYAVTEEEGHGFTFDGYIYYVHDKVNNKYYYVEYNLLTDGSYIALELFDRPEHLIMFKDVLNYDNNYKVYNGYFVPEEMLIIKKDIIAFRDKKITNIRDEYNNKTVEGLNNWFESMLDLKGNNDLYNIKLDFVDYIDINNLSNLTVTFTYFISKSENLNLLELVDKGLMTYDYVLNEAEKEIEFTINYLNKEHTFNTNYYDSSKGAYFMYYDDEFRFEDGFYYQNIFELPLPTYRNQFVRFTGYMAAKNGPVITEKADLLPYIRTKNIVYLYPVDELYEYVELVESLKDYKLDIGNDVYYDILERAFYVDHWYSDSYKVIFTDNDITFIDNFNKLVFDGNDLNDYQIRIAALMFQEYKETIEEMLLVDKLFSGKFTFFKQEEETYIFSDNIRLKINPYWDTLDFYYLIDGYNYSFRIETTSELPNVITNNNHNRRYVINTLFDITFKAYLFSDEDLYYLLDKGYSNQILEDFYLDEDYNVLYDDQLHGTNEEEIVLYAKYNHVSNYLGILDDLKTIEKYQLESDDVIMVVSNNSQIDVYLYNYNVTYYWQRDYILRYVIDLVGSKVIYFDHTNKAYELHEDFKVFNIVEFINTVSKDDFIYDGEYGELVYIGPDYDDLHWFSINLETYEININNNEFFGFSEYELNTDLDDLRDLSVIGNFNTSFDIPYYDYAEVDLENYNNYVILGEYDDLVITIYFESGKQVYLHYLDLYQDGVAYIDIDEDDGEYYVYIVGMFAETIKAPFRYEVYDPSVDKIIVDGNDACYIDELEFWGEYVTQFNDRITIVEQLKYLIYNVEAYSELDVIYIMPVGGGTVD